MRKGSQTTFIRLTQLDGKRIWFNQEYIVTIEPRKGSGSLVVPLGDGLDYEVIESPERIVEALGGSISPKLEGLEGLQEPNQSSPVAATAPDEPAFSVILSSPESLPAEAAAAEDAAKPARKTRGRTAKVTTAKRKDDKATAAKTAKATAGKKKAAKSATAKKVQLPSIPLTEEQLIRLQKMSPGSMKKLVNTLMAQFGVTETEHTVDALLAREVISVSGQGHVEWNWRKVGATAADGT